MIIGGQQLGRAGSAGTPHTVVIPPTAKAAGHAKVRTAPETRLTLTAQPAEEPVAPPAAEPEPAVEPEPLPTMTVREGDTLSSLAEWFGVSAFDIAAVNGMSAEDYLQIGQELAIPVSSWEFVLPPETYVAVVEEPEPEAEPAPPPPAAPTTAPQAAAIVAPPPAPYTPPSGDAVIAAICALPWPCETMVRVARCESGLNPRAVNPAGYYGLFQIDTMIAGWDDAATNASYAYYNKYLPAERSGDGLRPWPVCRYVYSGGSSGSGDTLSLECELPGASTRRSDARGSCASVQGALRSAAAGVR